MSMTFSDRRRASNRRDQARETQMTQVPAKQQLERRIFEALAPLVGADVVDRSLRGRCDAL